MPNPIETRIRDTALDIAVDHLEARVTHAAIAEQAEVSLSDVAAFCPLGVPVINCLLEPFANEIDQQLARLPIHASPTLGQQREILNVLVDGSTRYVRELALIVHIRTDIDPATRNNRKATQFAYQAAVRLLGSTYDEDVDALYRVNFAIQMLAVAIASRRQDFTDPAMRDLLVDSVLAAMHPHMGRPVEHRSTRWTDKPHPTSADRPSAPPSEEPSKRGDTAPPA